MVQCETLELRPFLLGEGSGDHGRLTGHVSVIRRGAVTGPLPEGKRETLGCFCLLGFISPSAFCLLFTLCQHPISSASFLFQLVLVRSSCVLETFLLLLTKVLCWCVCVCVWLWLCVCVYEICR